MRIFGLDISRARSTPANLSPVSSSLGGWYPIVRESSPGAWQHNVTVSQETALAYFAVYGCVSLIATDVAKLYLRLVEQDADGFWQETTNPAYSPVLRKPNRYQTITKFVETWITSKLTTGNTYVLKERDARGVVTALYVLDPARVTPLVAPDGAIYYRLSSSSLAGVPEGDVVIPQRELIHDPMICLFPPYLIGVTPLYACGLSAQQGLTIQSSSEAFFRTGSNPGGVLTAPGAIATETAQRLKAYWDTNFSGANVGKVAILGDGLKYEAMSVNAVDAQLIEQLQFTAQTVCTCFHVPPELLDLRPTTDLELVLQKYHAQCLQSLLTNFERSLDEGLELKPTYGTEFDLDDLIWTATAVKTKAAADAIGAGAMAPNEARAKYFGLGPVKGGDSPMAQQQYYSLAALAARDQDEPFAKPTPATPAPIAAPVEDAPVETEADDEEKFMTTLRTSLEDLYAA
jgi:HK97 family phage portal protein